MSDKLVYVLNYWLKNAEDVVVDTSDGGVPMMFMQGCKNTIQGIQDAVKGRVAGERIEAVIPPELAYGTHKSDLISIVPQSVFDGVEQVSVGMKFQTNAGGDAKVVKVVAVKNNEVSIDANHPLAGLTLKFELELVDVRKATEEERLSGKVITA
ncbi:MAG: FKBP-type peptidyl-prolyl cis-trans isomerase SlyD [Pseudohongiellaceae bacterium]|jgi:FKBP-type peptidyl-prolyl cis-trans isomerase SlyD